MKSGRANRKSREPDPSVSSVNLNVALQIVSLTEAKQLIKHLKDPIQVRRELSNFLENPQKGNCQKPKRLGAYNPEKIQNFQPTQGRQTSEEKRSSLEHCIRKSSIHLPGEYEPETDLWYAAFLDYLMDAVYWAVREWIPGCHSDLSEKAERGQLIKGEQAGIKLPEDEQAVAVATVLATLFVLIGYLQRMSSAEVKQQDLVKGEYTGSNILVPSIRLIRNFFQNTPQPDRKLDYGAVDLAEFELHHRGMLAALSVEASIRLIQFLTNNFLHLFRLIEKCFDLTDENHKHLIEIPCPRQMHTLPRNFSKIRSVWPPPLCEALPLEVIANHQRLFDERVTKWLPCLPPAEIPAPVEAISDRTNTSIENEASGPEETPIQPLPDLAEKYLSALDRMDLTQWKAMATISDEQALEVVRLVLAELPLARNDSSRVKQIDQLLSDSQIKLAKRLVDRAKQKLEEAAKNAQKVPIRASLSVS